MGFLQSLLSSGAGTLVDSIGKVVDNVVTTKEEKMQLELEMKKADMQYATEMRKMEVEEEGLYLADTQNARQREKDIAVSTAAPWYTKAVAPMLAMLTTTLTFLMFYLLIFKKLDGDKVDRDIVIYILGVLSAILSQIFSYYFGSSMGSAEKSRMIGNIQKDLATK